MNPATGQQVIGMGGGNFTRPTTVLGGRGSHVSLEFCRAKPLVLPRLPLRPVRAVLKPA
jgi:hypothetical protein